MELSTPKAWATTNFGDNCIVLAENKEYMQIICQEKYPVSNEGVQKIWSKILDSAATMAPFLNNINYDKIGIKFLKEDGQELMEIVLKRENGTYSVHSVSGNLEDTVTLLPAIMQVVR